LEARRIMNVKDWIDFESEKFGQVRILISCHDYEDYPDVWAIHGILINEDTEINIGEDDTFDLADWLTPNDMGSLLVINRQMIKEHYQDAAEARADAMYDEWKDIRYERDFTE